METNSHNIELTCKVYSQNYICGGVKFAIFFKKEKDREWTFSKCEFNGIRNIGQYSLEEWSILAGIYDEILKLDSKLNRE